MRRFRTLLTCGAVSVLWMLAAGTVKGQGYDTPLTFQGLNHMTRQSAASRAAGGITLGIQKDVSVMFSNPAVLTTIQGIQFSFGGFEQTTNNTQEQRYGGLQDYSAFSLLMEGTTGTISDPDSIIGTPTLTDTVQRPFDSLGPNWDRSRSKTLPLQAFVAVPFQLRGVRLVVGAGFTQYANMNRFYQNNNVLAPSVLSVLDSTIREANLAGSPFLAGNTYDAQWYQYYQQREGSIYGYGGSLSASFNRFSVGVSGRVLSGSTDDSEARIARGRLVFYSRALRLDKLGMVNYTRTGTSDFSGFELTLSGRYTGKYFDAGFSFNPPTTITRKFTTNFSSDTVTAVSALSHRVDSLHASVTGTLSGEDKMQLPWRGNVGIAIRLREDLRVGLEYEIRSYADAKYTDAAGNVSNPWISSFGWRVGVEFEAAPWLLLRGGVHDEAEVFEPLSNAIRGQAPGYTVYSVGVGLKFANARLNVAYEYGKLDYVDTWANAVSINTDTRNTFVADISYEIPW